MLAARSGKTLTDVWNEVLTRYRVRIAREVRPPPEEEKRIRRVSKRSGVP